MSAAQTVPLPVRAAEICAPRTMPFLAAAALYVAISAWIVGAALNLTGGHFVYALDDPYITMAIAKNFALHGVWGVTPYGFSSASSTPLFVLLLAATYRLLGVSEYAPLAFSWTFGLAAIGMAARMLSRMFSTRLSLARQTVALVALVLFTPLFAIGTLGMEHSLQVLLTLLFLHDFENDDSPTWRLAMVTALLVATRYEGLFLALPAVLFLLLRSGRRIAAVTVFAASALPVALYAWMSFSHHGYWLPNSVALKGLSVDGLGYRSLIPRALLKTMVNAIGGFYLSLLLAGVAALAVAPRRTHRRSSETLGLVVIAGCFHMICADVAWPYRYEDYLIAASIICAARYVPLRGSRHDLTMATVWTGARINMLFLLAGAALTHRAIESIATLPHASRSIYSQQWQMARFVHAHYPHGSIAANDIGALNFENDLHCLDLVGLGNAEVFAAKRSGLYATDSIERLAAQDKVQIAIVYDSWFTGQQKVYWEGPRLPSSWTRVQRWRDPNPRKLGSDTISFYAIEPGEAGPLRAHLAAFRDQLPPSVIVSP